MKGDPLETYAAHAETIAGLAADAFKDHQLKPEGDRRWTCKRPGTGMYTFRVILAPGTVIITGDIGDAILHRISYTDPLELLGWLRGMTDGYPDYTLSKLVHPEAYQQFFEGDAVRWAKTYAVDTGEDAEDFADEVRQAADHDELSRHQFLELAHEHGVEDCYKVGAGHSSEALWLFHALRTFIRLYDAQEASA